MFDKEKVIRMTADLVNFVRIYPNIFILPEVLSANVLSLLKRLNANVVAIITNAPSQQNVIRMPSGEYQLINFQAALPNFQQQTALIISATKPAENSILPFRFNIGNIKIEIPAFTLTDEEALAIYDRLTTMQLMQQYENDGIVGNNFYNISCRFVRGLSTFLDSQFQDLKMITWDRREFIVPSYNEVDDAAIVMQGPLQYMDNYTITTARLYRQWYPNAPIIISTWKDEATENFREDCKKIGVVLLENELPPEPGALHVNYQLESSLKGVEYAKNNTSAKFVLKCRTDQRINRWDFLVYFKNMLKIFPPNGNKLIQRILLLQISYWRSFFCCDFLYFGKIEDIHKLFNIPKQSKEGGDYFTRNTRRFHHIQRIVLPFKLFTNVKINRGKKLRNYNIMENKFEPPETFILKSFYKAHIAPIDTSKLLQTYWKFIRDYLIVVDESLISLDWFKVKHTPIFPFCYNYIRACDMDHASWLNIYLNYKDEDE